MENNGNINSPLTSTNNSGNKINTVYINDIESLNDSTENNDFNFNSSQKEKFNNNNNKGKFSQNNLQKNFLNKNEEQNIKKNCLNKTTNVKEIKEKLLKNSNNNILSNKIEDKKENEENKNSQRSKPILQNYYDEINRVKINKIINKSNNSENRIDKNGIEKFMTYNEKEKASQPYRIKKNNSLNLNLIKVNGKEMLKEINFLKKEIKLKNSIIQKLIEENKNLNEKIKQKEVELIDYKNKEENLAKVIQENNKCISNLNKLILRLVPKNEEQKICKNLSKSRIEEKNTTNIMNSKILKDAIKKPKNKNEKNNKINKEKIHNNSVKRYFKIHARNNINSHSNMNNLLNNNRISDNNINQYLKNKGKNTRNNTRNNTISIDFSMLNNNHSNLINRAINYSNNNSIMKSSTNNLTNKSKNKKNILYNIDALEENKSDCNTNYFTGNISCKNEIINKNLDVSPKNFYSNNNASSNDIFSYSNINRQYKIFSPPIQFNNKEKNDKSYNLKYFKNFNFIPKDKQHFLKTKNNNINILYMNDYHFNNDGSISVINKKNNYIEFPLNKENILQEKYNYFPTRNLE